MVRFIANHNNKRNKFNHDLMAWYLNNPYICNILIISSELLKKTLKSLFIKIKTKQNRILK